MWSECPKTHKVLSCRSERYDILTLSIVSKFQKIHLVGINFGEFEKRVLKLFTGANFNKLVRLFTKIG